MRVLILLMFCNICCFSDRVVLNLLVHPIQRTLGISDSGISLLQGLAFALFYTLALIPVGQLVDSVDRRKIIGWGTVVYGISTVFCGVTRRYWTLFVGRMGVGAGEATLQPAGYSLLADTVPRERLATTMGIFHVGSYIGIGCGYIAGGAVVRLASQQSSVNIPILGDIEPWQLAFILAGLPSLLAAILVLRYLRDPGRRGDDTPKRVRLSLDLFVRYLRANASLLFPFLTACAFGSLVTVAGLSWTPTFFIRVYGMSASETGLSIGSVILFCSSAGVILAGRGADILSKKGRSDGPVLIAAVGLCMTALTGLVLPLMVNRGAAFSVLAVREFFGVFLYPMAAAAIQMSTPKQFRGRVSALYVFVTSFTGGVLGPTVTALLNDHIFTSPGGVRYSLALIYAFVAPTAAIMLLMARKPFITRIRRVDADAAPSKSRP